MKTQAIERDGVRFVECAELISEIEDALGLISGCAANHTSRLLLGAEWLPAAFFDLSTRFAGGFIQKLQNYRIRVAAVIPANDGHTGPFKAFLIESRRGDPFRTFESREAAEQWLCAV